MAFLLVAAPRQVDRAVRAVLEAQAMRTTRSSKASATTLVRRVGVAVVAAAGLALPLVASAPADAASYSGYQWALQVVGAPTAWRYGTGTGVKIGIVDTGVDGAQQDLAGKVVAGATFLSNPSPGCANAQQDPSGADDNGHGTHVAGIAAASGQYGVTGMAPGASLVVAKVLDCTGSGQYQDVVTGINWVVQHGARVVNLSLGDASIGGLVDPSNFQGSPLGQALQAAWNAGAIPVIAAGNNSGGLFGLGDANYSGVPAVVVAATGSTANGEQDSLASYSNDVNNAQWGVAAPGGDDPSGPTSPTCGEYDKYEILSTYWTSADATGCYATDEGTSMATPFVTGTLADLLGRGLSASQAVQTLLASANHAVACGSQCSGLIDAGAAMQATANSHAEVAGPAKGVTTAPASSVSPGAAPAPPGTRPAAATPTTNGPTTTLAAPTHQAGSTAPAPASPSPHAALGADPGTAPGASPWWIALAIGLGLGAATLSWLWRRRRALRRATVATGAPERSAVAWPDWTSTN